MAKIEIESAFIESWNKNDEQHPAWGMKTAEPHSRKNDAGKYETVGRTFRTVKVSRSSGIDLLAFRKGDRVSIWGREVTETREHDGKKYYDLVLWADRVEVAEGRKGGAEATSNREQAPADAGNQPGAQAGTSDAWNAPANYTEETPW